MIKRGFQRLMQQRFVLQCLLGLCIVSMVSNLNVSNNGLTQAPEESPLTVSVELSATAQTASNQGNGNIANKNIDANEIDDYARAVLGIEQIRLSTLTQIQDILGSTAVPSIACHEEETVSNLPSNAQDLVVTFCQASIGLVEETGLSIEEFNQITNEQQSDPALYTAIQDALKRLQTNTQDEESVSSVE